VIIPRVRGHEELAGMNKGGKTQRRYAAMKLRDCLPIKKKGKRAMDEDVELEDLEWDDNLDNNHVHVDPGVPEDKGS